MRFIQLTVTMDDEYVLKYVSVDLNTTDLPSDSKLVKQIAIAILKSLKLNKDDIMIQDLLNELNIKKQPKEG